MKNPTVVLNGFCDKYENRLGEILGVLEGYQGRQPVRRLIFLCESGCSLDEIRKLPAENILVIRCQSYQPEKILKVLEKAALGEEMMVFDSGYGCEELAVRLACRMDGTGVMKVKGLSWESGKLCVQKNVYSNHMTGTFAVKKMPCFLSVAAGVSAACWERDSAEPEVEEILLEGTPQGYVVDRTKDEAGLEDAAFLLAVGRGAGSRESVRELEEIAQKMGASLGVSRPVAMSAWAPMDRMIGVSGTLARPRICIAAGASGAPAFYAGIEKSEFIVAVNTDEKADLLRKADVAVTGDCMGFLRALGRKICDRHGD